jgi:N-acetylglucosaminyldiphosphoundecaprenol N-acetyl-beta-D-mannosaminyltransferase
MSDPSRWNGERVNILGVGVSAMGMTDAVNTIDRWVREKTPNFVCVTGVHGVMESQRDLHLRAIHNRAGMVTADGMPLVWMGRRLGHSHMQRVYGPDLMRAIIALSPTLGYRHFFFGGAPGVADRLATALMAAHPGLNVVGTHCPPFRPLSRDEDAAIVSELNAAKPDIIWVGLSTPKQEYWMASNVGRLNASALIGVGAAFDFLAGTKKQAPPWMQRNGLEWLFRLASEPRRLWRRYLHIVPGFIFLICAQSVRSMMSNTQKSRVDQA